MENGNKPINQGLIKGKSENGFPTIENHLGLTKREYFAGLAMQGALSNHDDNVCKMTEKQISKWAVMCADELLKQLEK